MNEIEKIFSVAVRKKREKTYNTISYRLFLKAFQMLMNEPLKAKQGEKKYLELRPFSERWF